MVPPDQAGRAGAWVAAVGIVVSVSSFGNHARADRTTVIRGYRSLVLLHPQKGRLK